LSHNAWLDLIYLSGQLKYCFGSRGETVMDGKFWANVGLSTVVVGLLAFAVSKFNASSTGIAGVLLPEITVSESAEELLHSVALVNASVNVSKKDHMVDASFSIANTGTHDIKNVAILCTLFDAAGNEQGRNKWVVFDTVQSQNTGDFTFVDKKFISNSIVRSDCKIVDMQIASAPRIKAHSDDAAGHGNSNTEHAAPVHGSQH